MRKISVLPIFLVLILSLLPAIASAADAPFTYPSNWGGTGLMEIPTARVIRENSYRIGAGQVSPYRYFYGAFSPVRGLEIDGRITEVTGVPGFANNNSYGNFKDKAVDLKYQFIPEGKYLPALSIGIMDPHGTRLYSSQYLVMTKQIYPFDFTLGFGNGRLGKRPLPAQGKSFRVEMINDPYGWARDGQFFWGVQFAPSERYALMLEYSPVRYDRQTRDPAHSKYFTQQPPSHYNIGLRLKPSGWSEIDVTWQRGNRFGINLSANFNIGDPLVPIYDPPYREGYKDKQRPVEKRLARAIHYSGFSDVNVRIDNRVLYVTAQNDRYFYNTRAIGEILAVLNRIVPAGADSIRIVLAENGVPKLEMVASMQDISDLFAGRLTLGQFLHVVRVSTRIHKIPTGGSLYRQSLEYGLKPSFETFLNDPSGFFKYRLGISGWVNYHPWRGASLITGISAYPVNTVSTVNTPLSIPVRSDLPLFLKERFILERIMLEQISRFRSSVYTRLSAGLLEAEYAGVDAEVARPFLDGRLFLGINGSILKKRSSTDIFRLKKGPVKNYFSTAFLNARINIPERDVSVGLTAGRFLAGDTGARLTVSKFMKGVTIWAWYTVTDTSIFTDSPNRGYHDKGIGITIPMRLFSGSDSKTTYTYSLSPWTRDVGQDIDHYHTLFDTIGRDTKIIFDRDSSFIYK